MANQITDNRTLIADGESVTNWTDPAGTASGSLDSEVTIEGTNSIADYLNNAVNGLIYNRGATSDMTGETVYAWFNCGAPSFMNLLGSAAGGGIRMRFCGPTITDYFDVNLGGRDTYTGGWVQFAVDVAAAKTASDVTGGTPPAITAIQRVGIIFDASDSGTKPRMVDNTWVDAMWVLASGAPGIIVEGRNGGTTDWNLQDIVDTAETGTNGWGMIAKRNGVFFANAPIQFGINDTSTHGFTETNSVLAWEDQPVADTTYFLSALGNAGGTTNVTFGVKSGTGDTATGQEGVVITADSLGNRWNVDANDPNIDSFNFYGCTLSHSETLLFDDAAVEVISTQISDSTTASLNGGLLQRSSILTANTADGVAWGLTSDLASIKYNSFVFSDGHALEIDTAGTYTFTGNDFNGYGAIASTDAAIENSSAGLVTINIGGGGSTPTYRNTGGGSTVVNNNVAITLTGMKDLTEVRVFEAGTGTIVDGIEDATAGTIDERTFTFSDAAGSFVDIRIISLGYLNQSILNYEIPTVDSSIPIQQTVDRNYINPA